MSIHPPDNVRHRSLWLNEVAGDAPDQPPLSGSARSDIAIIGGGYVGLWTAIRIKEHEPDADVVVLEQDICGGGASGRNGGFVLSWWPKLASLSELFGREGALRVARESEAAIGEIGEFCRAHSIDADFVHKGFLWTATSRAQLGAWDSVVTVAERMGASPFVRLEPEEVAARTGSRAHLAGVFEPSAATVQPAALVRGLRRVALEMGVRLHEGTRVLSFSRDYPVAVRTPGGLLAANTLVIASNAWAAGIRELRNAIVVISSDMIATAPMPDRLSQIGWTGGEAITDSQLMVDYYRTTRDGRIAFGKGGWGIALGGSIGRSFDRDVRRAESVTADFHRYYPMLADVPIDTDWSGPIDRTQDSLPILGHLGRRDHIVYGVGWSGNGVGPSAIGGRILASLALRRNDAWGGHPLVGRRLHPFPPEPIRYVGAHVVREAVIRKERAEAQDRTPHPIAVQLTKFAPAGLEDK